MPWGSQMQRSDRIRDSGLPCVTHFHSRYLIQLLRNQPALLVQEKMRKNACSSDFQLRSIVPRAKIAPLELESEANRSPGYYSSFDLIKAIKAHHSFAVGTDPSALLGGLGGVAVLSDGQRPKSPPPLSSRYSLFTLTLVFCTLFLFCPLVFGR